MCLKNYSMCVGNSNIWMDFTSKGLHELNMKIIQRMKLIFFTHVLLEFECENQDLNSNNKKILVQ